MPKIDKGSCEVDHCVYKYPAVRGTAGRFDGRPGDDTYPYQEKDVREAIKKVRSAERCMTESLFSTKAIAEASRYQFEIQ